MQGKVLAGRYELVDQLGKGGMGSVWRAKHLALSSWVAVKLMDESIAKTTEGAERFKREAHAAASLRSSHVVQVLDYGVDGTVPFLVMEMLTGESLAAHLERHVRLSPERTLTIVTQLARAVGRAHTAGIVHRDLKPDNVFLVEEEDHEIVKVLDFGIAKTTDTSLSGLQTRTGMTMGTPHYMSPEQAEGTKTVDYRTDLWAMSVITCECLTGQRPFGGETFGELLLNICARPMPVPSTIAPVPEGFDAWFAKGTARDQAQRFGSAKELAEALSQALLPGGMRAKIDSAYSDTKGALTGGVATATGQGAAPATPQAVEYDVPAGVPKKRGGVAAVVAAAFMLLAGGAAAAYFVLGSASAPDDSAADGPTHRTLVTQSEDVPAPEQAVPKEPAASAAAAPAVDLPTAEEEEASARSAPRTGAVAGKESAPTAKPKREKVASPEVAVAPEVESEAPEPPKPAPKPRAKPQPKPATAPTLRCYKDSFTGAVRRGTQAGSSSFACRKNPFTGQYQRL